MRPDFDPVASFYYPLSRLFFGKSQLRAQEFFLPSVKPGSRILIVGGGDGQVLRSLSRSPEPPGEITFVESSPEMIRRAGKQDCGRLRVTFIEAPVEEYLGKSGLSFDVIHTAFFFDLFPQEEAGFLFDLLNRHLEPGGQWLYTDFHLSPDPPRWHRLLMNLMYRFFTRTVNLQTNTLPEMQHNWEEGFRLAGQRRFYHRLIVAQRWIKEPHQAKDGLPASRRYNRGID